LPGMVGFTCDKNAIDNPIYNKKISYEAILKDNNDLWMSMEGDERVELTILLSTKESR